MLLQTAPTHAKSWQLQFQTQSQSEEIQVQTSWHHFQSSIIYILFYDYFTITVIDALFFQEILQILILIDNIKHIFHKDFDHKTKKQTK